MINPGRTVDIRGLSAFQIADMARTEAMYMRDVLTGGLIRLPGGDSRLVTTLLRSGWVDAASVLVGDEATVS